VNRILLVGLGGALAATTAYVGIQGNPLASANRTPNYQTGGGQPGPAPDKRQRHRPGHQSHQRAGVVQNPGKLTELDIATGDRVVAGQVLARLDVNDLQVQLGQSQATLSQQEANEAKIANGATPELVAAAEAQVQSAAVTLDGSRQGLETAELSADAAMVAAQADVRSAEQTLAADKQALADARAQMEADGNPLGLGPAVDCRHIRFTDVAEGSR
jgi:multidrug efflux pump subunit AcrA (membrane-fusion protein)